MDEYLEKSLSDIQRSLLRKMKEKGLGAGLASRSIKLRPKNRPIPLSHAQQRIWFVDQAMPRSTLYNVPAAVRMVGPLDLKTLGDCFSAIVARHDSLRTIFVRSGQQPVQMVQPSMHIPLSVVDLSAVAEEDRKDEVNKLAGLEAERPFSLARGPLLRTIILRTSEQENVLLLTMHHIIFDGRSLQIFAEELASLYRGLMQGEAVSLPSLYIQYPDFAYWERQLVEEKSLAVELEYWREKLRPPVPQLRLPPDYPRPANPSWRGACETIPLSLTLQERLRSLARREGTTLFTFHLAAFLTLLFQWTGQQEIVLGTPVANRNCIELENVIGFFVNTVVLRFKLFGELTFRELVGHVRQVTTDAFSRQTIPFDKLVDELNPMRRPNQHPFFQVIFTSRLASVRNSQVAGLSWEFIPTETRSTHFDLILDVIQGERPSVLLKYSCDLFSAETAREILCKFNRLLESLIFDPDRSLLELGYSTEQMAAFDRAPEDSINQMDEFIF